MNTPAAVIGGLTYNFMPFALLPIYVSLEKVEVNLIDAAADLYSSFARTFRKVILPLSLPGVFAGTLLVFIPASGDFINNELLGNAARQPVIGGVIQARFLDAGDLPTAVGDQLRADGDDHGRRARLRQVPRDGGPRVSPADDVACGRGRSLLWIVTIGGLVYLFVPLVTIVVFTFNDPTGKFNTSWEGFTFDNWLHPFSQQAFTDALWREHQGGGRRLHAGDGPRQPDRRSPSPATASAAARRSTC